MEIGNEAAEYFARSVVSARDNTISNFDRYFSGESRSDYARSINDKYSRLDETSRQIIHELMPCIVDETIGIVLQVFDEMTNTFEVKLNLGDREISIYEVYELLEPEWRPEDGWIHKYSKQRLTKI